MPRSILPSFFEEPDLVRPDVPEVRGRVIVLVVDEMSFSAQALPQVIKTAKEFLTTLPPDDVVGLYAYPFGPARLDLTHYHNTLSVALNRLHGLRQGFGGVPLAVPPPVSPPSASLTRPSAAAIWVSNTSL